MIVDALSQGRFYDKMICSNGYSRLVDVSLTSEALLQQAPAVCGLAAHWSGRARAGPAPMHFPLHSRV